TRSCRCGCRRRTHSKGNDRAHGPDPAPF
ncbi:hypothetical protein AB1N83_012815, partial [Pleurotus pulmonarius]